MCLCIYHIYARYAYVCLYVSEMNNSDDKRDRREKLGLFCYYKVLNNLCSVIVLFESEILLVADVYCKL